MRFLTDARPPPRARWKSDETAASQLLPGAHIQPYTRLDARPGTLTDVVEQGQGAQSRSEEEKEKASDRSSVLRRAKRPCRASTWPTPTSKPGRHVLYPSCILTLSGHRSRGRVKCASPSGCWREDEQLRRRSASKPLDPQTSTISHPSSRSSADRDIRCRSSTWTPYLRPLSSRVVSDWAAVALARADLPSSL